MDLRFSRGDRHQKLISQHSTKGDALGQQGVESLRGEHPPPSKSVPGIMISLLKTLACGIEISGSNRFQILYLQNLYAKN